MWQVACTCNPPAFPYSTAQRRPVALGLETGMPVKLICASHTPLMDFCSPGAEVERAVRDTFATLAAEVRDYDPELVVVFGPDHFNGFFYDLMPSFCIGMAAHAIGDYGTAAGPLAVPRELAEACASGATEAYRVIKGLASAGAGSVHVAVSRARDAVRTFSAIISLYASMPSRIPN